MVSKTHNHDANQKGWKQPTTKPSPSTVGRVGVTAPIQKPSPAATNNSPGIQKKKGGM